MEQIVSFKVTLQVTVVIDTANMLTLSIEIFVTALVLETLALYNCN